jgi:beta-glucosidase
MAPGKSSVLASGKVIHHLNLAHGEAVAAFRASPAIGQIGPCLQLAPCYRADGSPEAAAAASAADTLENALYLEPVLRSRYPALAMRIAGLSAALTPQSWMAA